MLIEMHTFANSIRPMLISYEPYMLWCVLLNTIIDYDIEVLSHAVVISSRYMENQPSTYT